MRETDTFHVLASADRQILLHELYLADEPIARNELARQVAARRHQLTPDSVDEEKIERAKVRFHHIHLPMLNELNLIDQDNNMIELVDGEAKDQLRTIASEFDDWPPKDPQKMPS